MYSTKDNNNTRQLYSIIISISMSKKYSLEKGKIIINKRAQRALGRSPEEKVKDHRRAIYRGSLMLYSKYW